MSRDISLDTTDVDGFEAWVKFDENGKSKFSNLKFVAGRKPDSRVNFTYSSVKATIKNGLVHFGDVQHKISADAKNIAVMLEPENYDVPDEQKRYKINFASTDSNLIYDENPIQPVDIRAKANRRQQRRGNFRIKIDYAARRINFEWKINRLGKR